ncbi:MAG: acetyl-CoA carboxylase biotin carboxyl carrier protein subunit [Panacagrimonas sp.]
MHHAFKLGDAVHNVELSRSCNGYRLHLGERAIDFDLVEREDGHATLNIAGRQLEVVLATRGDDVFVHLDGQTYQLGYQHPLDRLAAELAGGSQDQILAPMPGSIISVAVRVGDTVETGQTLLVMESMKMETTISAPREAVIAQVMFEPGQSFDRDAVLLSMAPLEKSE